MPMPGEIYERMNGYEEIGGQLRKREGTKMSNPAGPSDVFAKRRQKRFNNRKAAKNIYAILVVTDEEIDTNVVGLKHKNGKIIAPVVKIKTGKDMRDFTRMIRSQFIN